MNLQAKRILLCEGFWITLNIQDPRSLMECEFLMFFKVEIIKNSSLEKKEALRNTLQKDLIY